MTDTTSCSHGPESHEPLTCEQHRTMELARFLTVVRQKGEEGLLQGGGGFKKCDTRNQKKATDFDLVHLGGEVENYSCDFGNMLILNMRFLIRNLSKKKIKRMVNVGKEFGFRG